jgi:Mycothiol maleylpyruvate isomerase N-terminal domain
MASDRAYVTENRREYQRLQALAGRLSDTELSRPLEAGWTIAGVLGHLAFWDQRTLVLLDQWERSGAGAIPRMLDEADVDWINDAIKPMLLALPPRRAAELAVAIAAATDARVAALSDERVAANVAAGRPVNLRRAEHRREHLDEIERALGVG